MLQHWPLAFALTLVVEALVAVPALAPSGSRPRRLGVVFLAQLATHPAVWFVWPRLGLTRSSYLLLAESFALLVETALYRRLLRPTPWSRALAASALANGASVLVGLLAR